MKRIVGMGLLCLALCLACSTAVAGEISLDSVYAKLAFPDSWNVYTPASVMIYEKWLKDTAGLDASEMLDRFIADDIIVEGYNEDFSESVRLIAYADDQSEQLYDIGRADKAQLRNLLAFFENRDNWKLTPYRYQEAKWVEHPTMGRFAFLRYNFVVDGETVERGIQYFTIRNGLNYFLETTTTESRFSNQQLAAFEEKLAGFTFTEELEAPPYPVKLALSSGFPAETGDGKLKLSGTCTSSATLSLVGSVTGEETPQVLATGSAKKDGSFTLEAQLTLAGDYYLALIASYPGMEDAQIGGQVLYQTGLLPVTIDTIPEGDYALATYELTGSAPAGARAQLLVGSDVHSIKIGRDGRFAYTLDTSTEGWYYLKVVVSMDGYEPRMIDISFRRVLTTDERTARIENSAADLTFEQMALPENAGKVVRISGMVVSETAAEGGQSWFLHVYVTQNKKQWSNLAMVTLEAARGFSTGDLVTFYAQLGQPYSDADSDGQPIQVPTMEMLWVVSE